MGIMGWRVGGGNPFTIIPIIVPIMTSIMPTTSSRCHHQLTTKATNSSTPATIVPKNYHHVQSIGGIVFIAIYVRLIKRKYI